MLQGTLDVFSLDEVLGLLSGANKNGVLNITGDRGVGSVSLADGSLVAGSASSAPEAAELSDVVFELLRYDEGSFSFDGAVEVEGDPHELEAIMTEAHARLDEWKSIEAVVPSMDHHVSLSPELATSQVTLSESEWATVVSVGEGATVGVVARRLSVGEFDGSKRIKSLIERSLASLEASAPTPAVDTPAEAPAPIADVEAAAPADAGVVFETPEPAPASFADVAAPVEVSAADIAADFSFETVAQDAPAFEDAPVEVAPVDIFAADSFAAADEDAEIPPMPEAPAFASFDEADTEVPPMPAPPVASAPFASEIPDIPAPPAADVPPPPFAGLDSIDGPDMFEAPRRSEDRSTNVFGAEGFDAGKSATEMDAPMPPPPPAPADDAMPSFAPPAGFDADAFGVAGEAPAAESAAAESAAAESADAEASEQAAEAKGGSLLMRYLKSNG